MMQYIKALFEKESFWIKSVFILSVPWTFSLLLAGVGYGIFALFQITDETLKLKLLQLFSAAGMFIFASFVLAYLFSRDSRQFLSLRKPAAGMIMLAALSMIIAIPVINFTGHLNNQIAFPESLRFIEEVLRAYEEKMASLTQQLLFSGNIFSGLVLNLLVMAIVPALGEEFLFRGVIQKTIDNHLNNKAAAVWITACLFSIVHFQFYGFIPRLLLGVYFGYLLIWSKSIWVPVAAHFVNNAVIVIYFFWKKEGLAVSLEAVGTENSPLSQPWAVGSAVLFAVIVYLISAKARKRESTK